jgi:hypothetical protein
VKHEGLHDMYITPNSISVITARKIETGGACNRYEVRRVAYRILVRKLERGGPLGRPRPRNKDYIRVDIQEIG